MISVDNSAGIFFIHRKGRWNCPTGARLLMPLGSDATLALIILGTGEPGLFDRCCRSSPPVLVAWGVKVEGDLGCRARVGAGCTGRAGFSGRAAGAGRVRQQREARPGRGRGDGLPRERGGTATTTSRRSDRSGRPTRATLRTGVRHDPAAGNFDGQILFDHPASSSSSSSSRVTP
jgi:hypothetical protein